MKHTPKAAAILASLLILTGCEAESPTPETADTEIPAETSEIPAITPSDTALTLTADLNKPENLSLLKKIAMYNAGTIDPITNYERDLPLVSALEPESLRIDLSIGKRDGRNYTGNPNLVSGIGDDWENYVYDFAQLDSIVEMLNGADILPYMSWSYIPTPLMDNPVDKNDGWKKLNDDLPNWQEAWKQIHYTYAKHYADAGMRIGYHEILNEPDLFGVFFDYDDFKDKLYNELYVYGAAGILEADPDAVIGGPAFAIAENAGSTNFLRVVKKTESPLDFFSFHSYMDGNTWPAELDYTNDLLNDDYFLTTAIHINEFSWLHSDNGGNDGKNSAFNKYHAASRTLDAVMEVVERTDVQWVHWAQCMESTVGSDPYGLIYKNGSVKAAYNAIKLYNDMPVWRYTVDRGETVRTICSADEDKISVLLWNTAKSTEEINLTLTGASFDSGTRRVYRIDGGHGSYTESPEAEHLTAEEICTVSADGCIWTGKIPSYGVVYITVTRDGQENFITEPASDFAVDVKTSYYYADRSNLKRVKAGESSYAHFDRRSWTMYLSQGAHVDAHASASVIVKELPETFTVTFQTEGNLRTVDKNSALAFRIDFYDEKSGDYTASVLYHNGIYDESRTADLAPWGTGESPDTVVTIDGNSFTVNLGDIAPIGWNPATGKAQVSFLMQNTGADTRAAITLSE